MSSFVRKPKDVIAGVLFLALGVFTVVHSLGYDIGTPRRMGPGMFPLWLGIIMSGLAVMILIGGLVGERERLILPGRAALRALVVVLIGSLAFALLLRPLGMLPAIALMVLIGSRAMPDYGWGAAILTAAVLSIGSVLIFVKLLGQAVPVFGSVFGV